MQREIRDALSEKRPLVKDESSDDGEYSVSADAGPNWSHDRIEKEKPGYISSTGFLGKASVVRWMEELASKLIRDLESKVQHLSPNQHRTVSSIMQQNINPSSLADLEAFMLRGCTYFFNNSDISTISGACGSTMNEYTIASCPIGETFVRSYFSTIHPVVPILSSEQDFLLSCHEFSKDPESRNPVWVEIMKLVFGIGSVHAHVQNPYLCNQHDHLAYTLGPFFTVTVTPTLDLPTMEHVQLATLGALYCIVSNQINRAWNIIGLAHRYASTRALHLINVTSNPEISDRQKEFEVRVWHSLSSLERLVSLLTGRPSSLQDRFISARFPRDEPHIMPGNPYMSTPSPHGTAGVMGVAHSSHPSSIATFVASLNLDLIIADTMEALYSSSTSNTTWANLQEMLHKLDRRLNRWKDDVPTGDLLLAAPDINTAESPFVKQQMYLTIRFYGACMLINHPCHWETQKLNFPPYRQSATSKKLDEEAALRCISAARELLRLLPVDHNPAVLYELTPWWCILHYIVQAAVVLITEISFDAPHVPNNEVDQLIKEAFQTLERLRLLSARSIPAGQALCTLTRLLRLALSITGKDNHLIAEEDTSTFPVPMAPAPTMLQAHSTGFIHNPPPSQWQN
ncbi:hypothetical protein FQN55_004873 [Onygenales sp. PD_40]|nr:hypothetical protein FQN55_004873 [Onygenales sp. PD_40]